MKHLIALTLLTLSTFSFAESATESWFYNSKHDMHLVAAKDVPETMLMYAEIYVTVSGKRAIRFVVMSTKTMNSSDYDKFSNETEQFDPVLINDRLVNITQQIIGDGKVAFFASTDKGADYVWNQFVKSKAVKFDTYEYSAMGFTEIAKHHYRTKFDAL